MTIIKRADLGRPLTWDELDDNFQQVDDLTAAASAAVLSASASATAAASSAAASATSATDAANSAANAVAAIVSAVKSTVTFTTGGTLNSNLDRISDGTYLYYWTGAYPVTVPAGSTVDGTGGVSVGAWACDTDLPLRQELASNAGASNVGTLAGITVEEGLTNGHVNAREQWRRQLADAGLTLVDGSFEEGATVTKATDAVWHIAVGQCYTWDGAFPKDVPAYSTPETSGGVGSGAWVSVGDSALRANLASGSGSSLVTYTNPNGPGVPMPLDVRIGQTYFMSDYGVSPSSTAEENTARINSVFSSLGGKPFITQFVFDCKGVVLINGSLLLKNNMDILIHAGTEIRNVAGTNRPVFISEYWFKTISNPSDLTQKSDYLGIRGGGIINYNKSGTAPGGLNTHAVCIAGVKRLKLGGNLKVGGAFKYAYLVANIDYLDSQNLEFDNGSDGLHLQPPIYHAYVRNLRGHTGDDLFAMTGGDYSSYDLGTRGNFTFIDVAGLFNDNTLCAVKLAGNTGVEFKHVSVRGIHGTCQHAPIRIWADHNLTKTTVKYAGFDDISAIPGEGHALCEIYDRGLGEVVADQVVVEGVSTNLSSIAKPVVDVRGSVGVTVYNLDMS